MSPIETVETMYAAFGRGDVPTILSCLAEDVEWEYGSHGAPLPWLQPLRGRNQVPHFFQALQQGIEITRFVPTHIMGKDRVVVALIDLTFTVKASGRSLEEPDEAHIWHFNDKGQVQRFRHRIDTWACVQAMQR
jgi:uncharacterized protein